MVRKSWRTAKENDPQIIIVSYTYSKLELSSLKRKKFLFQEDLRRIIKKKETYLKLQINEHAISRWIASGRSLSNISLKKVHAGNKYLSSLDV